jgi:hypothetical protein
MSVAMIESITEEREPLSRPWPYAPAATATTVEELLEHFTEVYADDNSDVEVGEDWATGQLSVFITEEGHTGYRAWIEE